MGEVVCNLISFFHILRQSRSHEVLTSISSVACDLLGFHGASAPILTRIVRVVDTGIHDCCVVASTVCNSTVWCSFKLGAAECSSHLADFF